MRNPEDKTSLVEETDADRRRGILSDNALSLDSVYALARDRPVTVAEQRVLDELQGTSKNPLILIRQQQNTRQRRCSNPASFRVLLALQGLQCDLGLELRGMVTTGLAHGSAPHFQVTVRADGHLSYCPGIGVHFCLQFYLVGLIALAKDLSNSFPSFCTGPSQRAYRRNSSSSPHLLCRYWVRAFDPAQWSDSTLTLCQRDPRPGAFSLIRTL